MEITSQNPIAVANFSIETVKKNVPKKDMNRYLTWKATKGKTCCRAGFFCDSN